MASKEKKLGKAVVNGCLAAHHYAYSDIAEQYRSIRNNIRFAGGDKVRSLAVTSPSIGDGKSTAAVNLAISMSQRGDRVLLIDANLRKPLLNHLFDINASSGLMEVLADQIDLSEAIQETGIDNLSLLPSGSTLYIAGDLLDSQSMSRVLVQGGDLYDMIVLDCPAVLEASDACALASKCDGAILIMNSGRTHREKALQAGRVLEFGKVTLLGAVLNRSKI